MDRGGKNNFSWPKNSSLALKKYHEDMAGSVKKVGMRSLGKQNPFVPLSHATGEYLYIVKEIKMKKP